MATAMSREETYFLTPEPKDRQFKFALGGAVAVEVLLILGMVWFGKSTPPVKSVKPKQHVMAVQMVTLPQPQPKVMPPKPLPKPVPPKPLVHQVTPPPPRPHPKVAIPPKPAPVLPASPVKTATPRMPASKPVPAPVPKPVATTLSTPPPMSPQQTASLMGRYVGMLRPMIQQNLHVPAALRAMGLSGKATIEFEISPAGKLIWEKVIIPSPLSAVNRAALTAVQEGGFPPFLKKMPKQNTIFQIDVEVGAGSSS